MLETKHPDHLTASETTVSTTEYFFCNFRQSNNHAQFYAAISHGKVTFLCVQPSATLRMLCHHLNVCVIVICTIFRTETTRQAKYTEFLERSGRQSERGYNNRIFIRSLSVAIENK